MKALMLLSGYLELGFRWDMAPYVLPILRIIFKGNVFLNQVDEVIKGTAEEIVS